MRRDVIEDVCEELRREGVPARIGGAKPDGAWVQMLADAGLKLNSTRTVRHTSISKIFNTLLLGRYFSHEITLPLPAWREGTQRTKQGSILEIIGERGPVNLKAFTKRAGTGGYIRVSDLTSGAFRKNITAHIQSAEPGRGGSLGKPDLRQLLFSTDDLKKVLRILRFEGKPTLLRKGFQTHLSKGAVVYNASQAMLDMARAGQIIWSRHPKKWTTHPFYSWSFCVQVLVGALDQVFRECYGCPFPWNERILDRELRGDANLRTKAASRAGFLIEPAHARNKVNAKPESSSPILRWKSDDWVAGNDLNLQRHITHRAFGVTFDPPRKTQIIKIQ